MYSTFMFLFVEIVLVDDPFERVNTTISESSRNARANAVIANALADALSNVTLLFSSGSYSEFITKQDSRSDLFDFHIDRPHRSHWS